MVQSKVKLAGSITIMSTDCFCTTSEINRQSFVLWIALMPWLHAMGLCGIDYFP
jgi:hypothetical protein